MFTGIIEEKGTVKEVGVSRGRAGPLTVSASLVTKDASVGDSICISGVCQTIVEIADDCFTVEVMPETLRRSTLGGLRQGMAVNLERSLRLSDRLGGHLVNGHVDGVGVVRSRRKEGNAVVFEFGVEAGLTRYIVPRGSIAVDGISLTVTEAAGDRFAVSVIPYTLSETTLEEAVPGTRVNLEVDVIAKYVESLLIGGGRGSLENALIESGFIDNGRGGAFREV